MTFSTHLNLEVNGKSLEVDFACWLKQGHGHQLDEPIFIVDEAKSFGRGSFTDKDLARLKRVGAKMPGTLFVLATLTHCLSVAERRRIARLVTWARRRNPTIILTGTELFARNGIEQAWSKLGGMRQSLGERLGTHMNDLRTLATATQQVYLGDRL